MSKAVDKKTDLKLQKRVILAFLKRVAQRIEKESGIKGWECLVDDDDPIDDEDVGVYIIGNESLDPSLVLEVNVERGGIFVFINNYNQAFLKIVKEEFPAAAKKLKVKDWSIMW